MRDNWSNKSLIEITSLIKDGTHGTHKDVINGIPLLSAKDIENGKVSIPEDSRLISESDFLQIHKSYKLQEEDILLTLVGTIGRVAIINDFTTNFTFQRSVGILRFIPDVDSKYAYYYICSEKFFKQLIRSMNASAQGGVYLGELGKLELEFPESLPHQRKIAHILSTCDAVIEKTEAAIAKYQAIKQGMMHDLFTRGILMEDITYTDKKGKVVELRRNQLRPKQEDAPELYKQSELGWIPKEWEVMRLEEMTIKIGDGIHTTPKYVDSSKYFFINGNNLNNGKIQISSSTNCVSEAEYKKHFKDLSLNTILYSINGTIGNIAIYSDELVVLGKSACYISFKNNELMKYLYHYLQTDAVNKFYSLELTGSTISNLSLAAIRNTPILLPNNIEYMEITKRIGALNNKIQSEQSTLSKYHLIKAGLMHDLLSGKVEVKVDEEDTDNINN